MSLFVKQAIEWHFCLRSIILQYVVLCLQVETLSFISEWLFPRDSGHRDIFTICLLLSRLFWLKKDISDLFMWQAPKFPTCRHSHCGNPGCWRGHGSRIDLCNSRTCPVAAGIAQEEKKQGRGGEWKGLGEAVWRKCKALCPHPFVPQHIEDNDDFVWEAGAGGQGSVCSRPCVGGLRAERASILSCCAS